MENSQNLIRQAKSLLEAAQQDKILAVFDSKSQLERQRMAAQVIQLEKVTPGGLADYTSRAKGFLENSKLNVNPFANYRPEIPSGVDLNPGEPLFDEMEQLGLEELKNLTIVLIAGGLGERLGYSGIKIDLPVTVLKENYCYLAFYLEHAKAYAKRAGISHIPFAIMVSQDTEQKTRELLEQNEWFGYQPEWIEILKQENVPALIDNQAQFAVCEKEFKICTKPHGHGDIHALLYQSGVAQKWADVGKLWMIFIQDTNALGLKAIPSVLGVSKKKDYELNSVSVPRKPFEAIGGLTKLIDTKDPSKSLLVNVEYNQLDGLLREKWNPEGDVANDRGFSHFPGNINTLVFRLPEYCENINRTKGVIPEFVNPKYADAAKTQFKAPTRLECMMQDYPKLLKHSERVGFTTYEPWFCFSPAKNNLKDASLALQKGLPAYSASSAEWDFLEWNARMLELAGASIERNQEKSNYGGIELAFGPFVIINTSFALSLKEIKEKARNIKLSKTAHLELSGSGHVENLNLDGTLIQKEGESLTGGSRVCSFTQLKPLEGDESECFKIRGYKV